MSKPLKNPAGTYEIEVKGKRYIVHTDKPDFVMDYRENCQMRKKAPFCCISHEPYPIPKRSGQGVQEYGYLCVSARRLMHHDTFPVYIVQKRKIHLKPVGGEKFFKFVYVYDTLDSKNGSNQGKIIRKIVA